MTVEITLLGRFTVTVDGQPVPDVQWRRRHAAALVKLLALSPRHTLHREQVIDALWPDVPVDEAGPRLHKAAHYARRAMGEGSVVLRQDTVLLFPDRTVTVDAARFERLAGAADDATAVDEALGLYDGPLLPEDRYEPWTEADRDRCHLLYLRLLRLAGRWTELAEIDPTDEQAQLAAMREHTARGDRRAALRQFERLDRALHKELGVGPGEEALALRDALLAADPETPRPDVDLIGRRPQQDRLEALLAEAARGRARTVLVSGPAGTGKSALLAWLRQHAAARGWRTAGGVAAAVEGAWPYAPAVEALADLARGHPALLDGLDDRFRAEIERLLRGEDQGWSGDGAHQRLFVAVAELVRLAAARPGLLLILDDVHEADEASLRLLHYVARSCLAERFLLVLAHRREGVTPAFEDVRASMLGRLRGVDLPLGPLDRDTTVELARRLRPGLGAEPARQVWEMSGGLPFAVVELARGPLPEAALARRPGAAPLGMLSPVVRQVLERVAVAGASFDTDEFLALAGLPEPEAFDCLDAALSTLVVERTRGGYRFRHPLIREALLADLPPHRARVRHRECAHRLIALRASPARIGHHLVQAGEPAEAVPYVLRAAETEAALGAYRDAIVLVESVRRYAEGTPRARLLALRADLLAATGDPAAVHAYRDAIDAADDPARRPLRGRLARAALRAGDLATAEAALDGLGEDAGDDLTVMLTRGNIAYFRGDLDAAWQTTTDAYRMILNGNDNWQVLDLMALQSLVAHHRGEFLQRIRLEMQRSRGNPAMATAVFDSYLCVVEYLLYGPMPYREVMDFADDVRASAQRAGALRGVAFAAAMHGEAALLAGELDEAEVQLQEAADLHRELVAPAGEAHSLQRLAEVHLARGDKDTANRLLQRALPLARWSMLAPHLLQRIYGTMIQAARSPVEARAIVDRAYGAMAQNDQCSFCTVMLALPAAMACADGGDLDDAQAHLAAAERSAALWEGTAWQAAIVEARAHLAAARGAAGEASRLLTEAAGIFDGAGQPLDAARCRADAVREFTAPR